MKLFFYISLLVIGGCASLSNSVFHSRDVKHSMLYDVETKQLDFIIDGKVIKSFFRFGIHSNYGFETLGKNETSITITLEDDLANILPVVTNYREVFYGKGKLSENDRDFAITKPRKRCKDIYSFPTSYPTYEEYDYTLTYSMRYCDDVLEITEKATDKTCSIDLSEFRDKYFSEEAFYHREHPLTEMFDFALQENDGSVLLKLSPREYQNKEQIPIYQLFCGGKIIEHYVSSVDLEDFYYIDRMSKYGSPAIIIKYDNRSKSRIVTLNGEIRYDGPSKKLEARENVRDSEGWMLLDRSIFLPNQNAIYFLTALPPRKKKDGLIDFELIRFNYVNLERDKRIFSVVSPSNKE
ncbi:MAG: hypothetical protein OEY78_13280 [Gammaproteobacteria bacterium]|nr:hypothetical protein [Gammaproteobacteria bacterium]